MRPQELQIPPGRRTGVLAAVCLLALPALARAGDPSGGEKPRTLFIGIDCVPYETVATLADPELGEDALFRGLGAAGPVPLISTFPSTTSVAFAGILEPLGLDLSPGYEAKFFDWERRAIRGGGLISYGRIKFPWREFWDWKLRGTFAKLTSGARPVKVTYRSIRRSLEAFAASDKATYFIYYTTPDLVSHIKSPPGLAPVLRRLDESLRELREEHPGRPFHVVLFSDHGNAGGEPLKNVRKDVYRSLEEAGYRKAKRLRESSDVAFVPFGLVSSFVMFTEKGHEAKVADVVGKVVGVQVCAAADGDAWHVVSPAGTARVRRETVEGEELFSYEPLAGDALGLVPVVEELGGRGRPPRPGMFPDAWWLEATRSRELPDPLYRIVRGFDLVANPASVICGTAPGHMFGPLNAQLASALTVGRLRWTHGALDGPPTLGFLMSDVPGWEPPPEPVRFNHALLPFLDGRARPVP